MVSWAILVITSSWAGGKTQLKFSLDWVAPLIADPPPLTPPLCTLDCSAKTDIYVLTGPPKPP